ncbi:MAG: undecaprenyl-diphosphate phosphatase [Theionarchaea archaeon]|nr:undecaprenyl-diphosphate phosphatase [Theionarchaea archaeon]
MAEPNLLLYLLMGAVQGLVEWFPLSSSGQISLTLQTAGVAPVEALSTALWIHFGSLLAILIRFRKDFTGISRSVLARSGDGEERSTGRFLVVGTLFTALAGIPVYYLFFEWFSNNPEGRVFTLLVGVLLVITGVVLIIGARMARGMRSASDVNWLDGAITGMAQGFAILPGISRSGFTVAALLGRRIDKADALKLSFFLDVPAILGAMVLTFEGTLVFTWPMAGAIAAAFVVSYYSMGALIDFARRIDLSKFCLIYGSLAAGAAVIQILIA